MDHRQMLLCLIWVAPQRERIVPISHSSNVIISLPAISADNGATRYIFRDEGGKCFDIAARKRNISLFDAGDDAEPEAACISEFLDRNAAFVSIFPFRAAILSILARPNFNSAYYRRLMMNSPSFPPRAAANATFVYFDWMRFPNSVAVGPYHTGAKLVKHRERRFISSDVKLALKLEGGLTGRLCRHEVGAPKPSRERHMARLHNRPGSERRIFLTCSATQHNRRAGCEAVRLASEGAVWACEAVRPAHRFQIFGASAVIREDALKLRKARWEGCIHV
jgi:hypothetical protein